MTRPLCYNCGNLVKIKYPKMIKNMCQPITHKYFCSIGCRNEFIKTTQEETALKDFEEGLRSELEEIINGG